MRGCFSIWALYSFMTDAAPNIAHIREMLIQMLQSYDHDSIVPKDILMVAVKGMEYYDLYINDQTGELKKISLIQLLHRVIKGIPMADEKQSILLEFLESPEFSLALDLIISASKGKFYLNKRINKNCMSFCCGLADDIHPTLDHSIQNLADTANNSGEVE